MFKLKSAIAGVASLAVVGGGLLALAGAASAAPTTPAWEPDSNAAAPYGNIVFYDSAGNVLTGGSNLSHIADFAAATTGPDSGAAKATMYFAAPDHTKVTGLWTAGQASATTNFPSTTAPAPVTGPGFTNPLVSAGATDGNLTAFLGGVATDTTAGYANIIQVRVKDSGPGVPGSGSHYWATDIAYNSGSSAVTVDGLTVAPGTWAQLYPVLQTTTTSISATPASPQSNPAGSTNGQDVTLTATVAPASAGTVQFFDGTTAVGSPAAVSGGTASAVAAAPAFGTHSYSAKFTPTGGTEGQGSTSSALSYVVNPPQTGTTIAIAGSSTTTQYGSASFTATMTSADSTTQAGSVEFDAVGPSPATTSTNLGTVATSTSTATLNLSSVTLVPGTYSVTAAFTPTNTTYATSTSPAITFTVTPTTCKGTPVSGTSCTDTQNIQVTVNPGSLTITTPYTASNPFVLPAMTLNSAGTVLSSGPVQFPKAGDNPIVVQSSLAGDPNWTVTVSGTDLTSSTTTTPIDGKGLGLTGGALLATPVFPGTVSFTDNAAHNPSVSPSDGNHGIKGGPYTFAASGGGGNGSAAMTGQLTLFAATQTQAGTYAGTITFAVS